MIGCDAEGVVVLHFTFLQDDGGWDWGHGVFQQAPAVHSKAAVHSCPTVTAGKGGVAKLNNEP